VIGGGVAGLATAWQLARTGGQRIGVVERFRLGHTNGSSHGAGRITRTSYTDSVYMRLALQAHAEEWPRLERDAGVKLIHACDGAFFGPAGSAFDSYVAAAAEVDAGVELIDVAEARRRFPLFRFPDAAGVLHDHTAGVVAAADTIRALATRCSVEGVFTLEDTRVLSIDPSHDPIVVDTDRGQLLAERLVITAGAWLPALRPEFAPRLTVRRQSVGYFRIDAPEDSVQPGAFPVWIHTGSPDNSYGYYGLPQFGAAGIKAGHHQTGGASQDPDGDAAASAETLAHIEAFLREQLSVRVLARVHAETCLYTNTDDEDFILGRLPDDERIVIGSPCSGHGFKFAPLTGRILAELSRDGVTSVPAFEAARERFAV
jgi:sarcosine oxidase